MHVEEVRGKKIVKPMKEVPAGMEVVTVWNMTLAESGSQPAVSIPAKSKGVIPNARAIQHLFDIETECPVLLRVDELLSLPTIVFLPWEAIEPANP